jgi:hypothetical protein
MRFVEAQQRRVHSGSQQKEIFVKGLYLGVEGSDIKQLIWWLRTKASNQED